VPEVEVATRAVRARVVETVVAAFRLDPAFRYFFPDPATFDRDAAAFAGWLFDGRVDLGTVWVADGGAAVAMWDGPHDTPQWTRPDLPRDARERIDAYERAVEPLIPREPRWYLGVLATHPDAAGRRLARAAADEGVRRAADQGLPAFLETTNPDNVALYERGGWRRAGRTDVGALRIWVMRR
jgi:ribosomal protein S18 acetylase RimI-like enzyme